MREGRKERERGREKEGQKTVIDVRKIERNKRSGVEHNSSYIVSFMWVYLMILEKLLVLSLLSNLTTSLI